MTMHEGGRLTVFLISVAWPRGGVGGLPYFWSLGNGRAGEWEVNPIAVSWEWLLGRVGG